MSSLGVLLRRWKKALGGLLGAATGVAVTQIAEAVFGWQLDPALANTIAVVLAGVGAWLAPKNEYSEVNER
jgi:hypothetical protein